MEFDGEEKGTDSPGEQQPVGFTPNAEARQNKALTNDDAAIDGLFCTQVANNRVEYTRSHLRKQNTAKKEAEASFSPVSV